MGACTEVRSGLDERLTLRLPDFNVWAVIETSRCSYERYDQSDGVQVIVGSL